MPSGSTSTTWPLSAQPAAQDGGKPQVVFDHQHLHATFFATRYRTIPQDRPGKGLRDATVRMRLPVDRSMGLRIAIVGAGGLGSYFGARLAQGGSSVAFIARGSQLAALHADGLHVESALGDVHMMPVEANDDPGKVGPVDVAIVSVKLWDLEAVAGAIAPLIGPETFVVSLQNGVDKDDVLRAHLGAGHVMGGVAYIAATLVFPGTVRHTGKRREADLR